MGGEIIDLRSDTVTKPCGDMRRQMTLVEVGDDVFGEDPTVNKLEALTAELTGHEAALFFPSGTQSNLVALMTHCQRGDEYIVGQTAHTYRYEAGGAAVLGSIQPQPLENSEDGSIPLAKIRNAIKTNDFHFARTRLIALENTTAGRVVSQDYIAEVGELARFHGLSLHLDGARVFNAAVAQNLDVDEFTRHFDSASICFSKGLGAPVGSALVGSKDFIHEARRWRKMVGGGMRQAGILASAAIYALENNIERLAKDHYHASLLAEKLGDVEGLVIEGGTAHTNMLYLSSQNRRARAMLDYCSDRGVLFTGINPARLVVHKDLSEKMILNAAEVIKKFFLEV